MSSKSEVSRTSVKGIHNFAKYIGLGVFDNYNSQVSTCKCYVHAVIIHY